MEDHTNNNMIYQSLLHALYTELKEETFNLATTMETLTLNPDNTFGVRLRAFENISDLIDHYKKTGCVLQSVFRVKICGAQAYLLGMHDKTHVANNTLCLVGAAFGLRVYGHCLLVDKEWVFKMLKKNLLYRGCATCGNLNATLKCAGCRCAYYCNTECQRTDWKKHKKTHFYIDISYEV